MKDMCAIVAIMAVFTLAVCFVMIGAASVELQRLFLLYDEYMMEYHQSSLLKFTILHFKMGRLIQGRPSLLNPVRNPLNHAQQRNSRISEKPRRF